MGAPGLLSRIRLMKSTFDNVCSAFRAPNSPANGVVSVRVTGLSLKDPCSPTELLGHKKAEIRIERTHRVELGPLTDSSTSDTA
jgi:hypothetical protein